MKESGFLKKSTPVYLAVFFGIVVVGMMISSATTEGYMNKVRSLVKNASIENFIGPFIELGFLATQPPVIQHATVGFVLDDFVVDPTPENGWTGDEYFANVISQCVFPESMSAKLCMLCQM